MKRLILGLILCAVSSAYAQSPPNIPGEVIAGWEFNAGPGKGNWKPEANRAEYPTLRDCEEALSSVMMNAPQPWPPGIRCAPFRKPVPQVPK